MVKKLLTILGLMCFAAVLSAAPEPEPVNSVAPEAVLFALRLHPFPQGGGQFGSGRSGGSGTVTSVSGTANQIDVATGTTTPVISLDSAITLPGNLSVSASSVVDLSAATGTTPFILPSSSTCGPGTNGGLCYNTTSNSFVNKFASVAGFLMNMNTITTVNTLPKSTNSSVSSFGNSSIVDNGTIVKTTEPSQAASFQTNDSNNFGANIIHSFAPCETAEAPTTLATGATTTQTGLSCLPANSIIDAVVARVTTTITAACTGWELGDGTTAARFTSNNTGLTAGTVSDAAHIGTYNNTGIASATTGTWQATATKITITCAGGNPGAGAIRIGVFYHQSTSPTS